MSFSCVGVINAIRHIVGSILQKYSSGRHCARDHAGGADSAFHVPQLDCACGGEEKRMKERKERIGGGGQREKI